MFLYSVGPSRIDQVIQCDLLHVTARVPILFVVYTDTPKLGNSLKTVPFVLGPKTVPFFTIFQCACFPPLSSVFSMHSVRIM